MLPILFSIMVRVWPHTPLGKRILIGPVSEEEVIPQGEFYDEIRALEGQLGVVRTPMIPSGMVMINGKIAWEGNSFTEQFGKERFGQFLKAQHDYLEQNKKLEKQTQMAEADSY